MPALWQLTAAEMANLVRAGEVSCRQLTEAHLDRIARVEPTIRAFLEVTSETALAQADRLDNQRASGDLLPPLAGVPMVLKDNLCTRGIRTTAGSRILGEWRPPYDATVVERTRASGAILVGKANLDEFAMGSSTEYSAFHRSHNPWDPERVPGGSSGGSIAAVAARMSAVGLGSDTGGSVRQPAAFCGIVGLKPTYGRVSRYGLIAYASSLDQIGPCTRTVEDAALVLQAIAGPDPRDSTCVPQPVPDYRAGLTGDIRGLRVGVPKEYLVDAMPTGVRAAIDAAIAIYRDLGADVRETSTPSVEASLAAYYIIAPAEASSNLARYDGVRYGLRASGDRDIVGMFSSTRTAGFGAEVKQRILLGTYALSAGYYDAYYHKALQVRTVVRRELERCWEEHDVLLTPTAPEVAFRAGEKSDPFLMKLSDVCTIPVNLAGTCAISVPCGFHEGLPVGLQLIGKPFQEVELLRAAHAYEQATDWRRYAPALVTGEAA